MARDSRSTASSLTGDVAAGDLEAGLLHFGVETSGRLRPGLLGTEAAATIDTKARPKKIIAIVRRVEKAMTESIAYA